MLWNSLWAGINPREMYEVKIKKKNKKEYQNELLYSSLLHG